MKRAIILPAVAILLLALYAGPYLLLLLIVIPIGYFLINRLEKAAPKRFAALAPTLSSRKRIQSARCRPPWPDWKSFFWKM